MPEGTDAIAATLQGHRMFAQVPPDQVRALVLAATLQPFLGDEVLIEQGQASDCAFLVLEGKVEVAVQTAYGLIPLTVLGPPALVGEIGALAGVPRNATVRGHGAGRALRIGSASLERLGQANPSVLSVVIGQLGGNIARFNQAIGFYTDALGALERDDADTVLLGQLNNPPPELMSFSVSFGKMAEQITLRRAQRREMASAAAIQRAMLPSPLPVDRHEGGAPRFDLHAEMRPARDVGGDFYDAFMIDDRRLAVTIGDVSGKGVPASLFMAVCQTVIRLVLRDDADLGRAIGRANTMLEANNSEAMFATFFGGIVDLDSGRMTYCNAGHNPPVVIRAGGGLEWLALSAPPLAAVEGMAYAVSTVDLTSGDQLLLYTDGVTEAHDGALALFGDGRLAAVASGPVTREEATSSEALIGRVFAAVDAFAGDAPQFDDLACVALTFRGVTPPGLIIEVRNEVAEIGRLSEAVEAFLTERRVGEAGVQRVLLTIDELASNVARCGWPDGSMHVFTVGVSIWASVGAMADVVSVVIRDDGVAFDPTAAAMPDVAAALDERPTGGLGLFLVAEMSEAFRYEREGHTNVTTVTIRVE